MITYSVIDLKENKTIASGMTNAQVRELLGMPNSAMVSNYANVGIKYKYRYEIQKEELQDKKRNRKITYDIKKDWDDMRKAAELLKTGQGRIVTRKVGGKLIKYTEVI